VAKVAEATLAVALPEIFDRFQEAAARVAKSDLEAVLTVSSLNGLPPVFTQLSLLRSENGQTVFRTDSKPAPGDLQQGAEPRKLRRDRHWALLADEFEKEPLDGF